MCRSQVCGSDWAHRFADMTGLTPLLALPLVPWHLADSQLTMRQFSYDELQLATNNFSNDNVVSTDGTLKTYRLGTIPFHYPPFHSSSSRFLRAGLQPPKRFFTLSLCIHFTPARRQSPSPCSFFLFSLALQWCAPLGDVRGREGAGGRTRGVHGGICGCGGGVQPRALPPARGSPGLRVRAGREPLPRV